MKSIAHQKDETQVCYRIETHQRSLKLNEEDNIRFKKYINN